MRIKKYLYIIMIGCMFVFTGCMPDDPFVVRFENLPENVRPFSLLPEKNPPPQFYSEPADEIKNTELINYKKDGWKAGLRLNERIYETYTEPGILDIYYSYGATNDGIRRFCELYREMRIAILDENGKILNITSTLNLVPQDYFGYPKEVVYDANTDSFSITMTVEKKIFGKTPTDWWGIITFLSWITDIVFISILSTAKRTDNKEYLKQKRIPLILLVVPGVISIITGIIINIVPYFSGNPVEFGNVLQTTVKLAVLNPFFIAGLICLPFAVKRSGTLP